MKKILIIDDDKNIRDIFRRSFEHAGYKIFTAENGSMGEEIFVEENPDLVILDIIMPEQEE